MVGFVFLMLHLVYDLLIAPSSFFCFLFLCREKMMRERESEMGGIEERKGGNADSVAQTKFRNRRL